MLVITTPTGQIGRNLVALLLEREQPVRVVVRDAARLDPDLRARVEVVEGSHRDADVMDEALRGADGLFVVVPPGFDDGDTRKRYLDFANAAADAVRKHGVGHVVGVTSAGHDWTGNAGVLSDAFAMDEVLAASGAAYRALSMPWYMENLLDQVDGIKDGTLALGYRPEVIVPSIATQDIASAAAVLLGDLSWSGTENVPVFGPDRLTGPEMATVVGEVLGRDMSYRQLDLDLLAQIIAGGGATEAAAASVTNMIDAQNNGIYAKDLADPTAKPAPTSFRAWCEKVLAPAVRDAEARA